MPEPTLEQLIDVAAEAERVKAAAWQVLWSAREKHEQADAAAKLARKRLNDRVGAAVDAKAKAAKP